MPANIVTGDTTSIAVTLYKGTSTFVIGGTAVVKAMLVSYDRTASYTSAVTQSSSTPGADWNASLVVVVIPGSETQEITYQGKALLEIQVTESGINKTWFAEVNIQTGRIA